MALPEARYVSVRYLAFAAVALLLVLSVASAQDFGGYAQNGGPIQFPPAPMSVEMSSVVIGGSGFGFVPPRAAGGYNFGSFGGYRGGGGIPLGGGVFGGYRGSASTNFGGFGGYGYRGGAHPFTSHGLGFVNYG